MRTILKISGVLSWFNLVVWGIGTCIALLLALAAQSFVILIIPFLISVIVLHSYAAIQLHKSIRNPARPLSNQTPVGIRFIGMIALFFGITCFINGITMLQDPKAFMQMTTPSFLPQTKDFPLSYIRGQGIFGLLCGLSICSNVILNFRLLRWYHFMKGMM